MHALPEIRTHKKLLPKHTRCVKCAEHHLTSDCPRKTQDGNVTCVNCNQPHPANYRGCELHKQLQQKIYPKLRERDIPTPPPRTPPQPLDLSKTEIHTLRQFRDNPAPPPLPTQIPQPGNDLTGHTQMKKNLMDQMSTLISLISALVTKENKRLKP